MTLLNEVMHRPLDPGYAEAAARRASGEAPSRTAPARVLALAVLAVVLGLITTAAAVDLRAPQPDVIAARDVLEDEILARQADTDGLTDSSARLSAEIEGLQEDALEGADGGVLADVAQEGAVTGARAVEGPGVVVTLADPDTGLAPGEAVDPESRVQDSDLQRVVNALWAGGAEAVAIDDQRLGGLTAIRSAGDAILVDLQPITSPYRVVAIGDQDGMQAALVRSGVSDLLRVLGSQYGIQSSVIDQSSLETPGRAETTLYFATATPATVESDSSTTTDPGAPAPGGQDAPGTEPGQENAG
ncbi:DUF881 domain-containing protein [Cellulosimicrobium arenosum]|uniref:DUF881 domain-containing protein n=2 Tax=Cellulosimicrobium arenosum TaxID=2708133 RepID=A0A927IZ02_9MICO|nr:DUF881 domain-containing protein [Cellulosimicrobium arenosum]MBD8077842.1 DUF881 domain-containing protein [Cellulosimicrobium arenosum]